MHSQVGAGQGKQRAVGSKTWSLALVLVTGLLAMARPAWAVDPGAVDVGVFGGYAWLSNKSELGDGFFRYDEPGNAALVGGRVGYQMSRVIGLEGEVRYAFAKFRSGVGNSPVLGYRAHGVFTLPLEGRVQPFAVLGIGAETLLASGVPYVHDKETDPLLDLGIGARFALTDELGLRLDLRLQPIRDRQQAVTTNEEVHLGLSYAFGGVPRDSDKDGIPDRDDKCPNEAENKNGFQDLDGCPDDPDSDGDGILDSKDKCPKEPENKNGFEDDDGCPDDPDSDGDGIPDSKDKCPKQPETKNGFQDEDGCPDDPDSDGDGIPDSKDKCPKQPETKNGFQDDDGCPDQVPDTDGDGIPDNLDKCPKEPETKNGFEDDDGCPDKIPEKLKQFAGAIKGIEFEVASAKILAKSFPLLDKAAEVMKEFKTLRVEISGHTDNSGDAEKNKTLSKDRAEAVQKYLTDKGIEAARLTAIGYGSDKPVADNKTKAGKAKNRRIEFKLM
jgi:outer membrane protein OmpA-like peptidoglycan-associated protein